MRYLKVSIPGLDRELTYSTDDESVIEGFCVEVPLGKRQVFGWVTGISEEEPSFKTKDIISSYLAFNSELKELFCWIADYYGGDLSSVIDTALPRQVESRISFNIQITGLGRDIFESEDEHKKFSSKYRAQYKVLTEIMRLGGTATREQLLTISTNVNNSINALEEKLLIEKKETKFFLQQKIKEVGFQKEKPTKLTDQQQSAFDFYHQKILNNKFETSLLFGITGSGKTEVYIRLIEEVINQNGAALVIVPEIALTPQLYDYFSSRLKTEIAILHSQISDGEKWYYWNAILKGEIKVAIGARSAVFAPLNNLRLIIVDEEHESSYKQSDNFRYNARDIAIVRAKLANCLAILGSATPSLETLHNVANKKYSIAEITERATGVLPPEIEIINLNEIKTKDLPSPNISPILAERIEETLAKKEQLIILHNKRGFSSYLQCNSCSEVLNCPSCSVTLTYHRNQKKLVCHLCNYTALAPSYCANCRDPKFTAVEGDETEIGKLEYRGSGTEKIVDEISLLFPNARIARLDRDTANKKNAYRKILGQMHEREADILIGTQMIAKGHDIPGVTLVGVIDADIGLHMPDFRSSERVLQLLTQVSGRAGRSSERGRVIIQTRQPFHPAILALKENKFKSFARFELDHRKPLFYPPWSHLMRIIVSSLSENEALTYAEKVSKIIDNQITHNLSNLTNRPVVTLLGPSPCPIEKISNRYRFHTIIKSTSPKFNSTIARELRFWEKNSKLPKDLRIAIDIDCYEMM